MKIPTLLGIAIIATLIALSGLYYYYRPQEAQDLDLLISDLKIVNVSGTSATVVWQTGTPVTGQVLYSQSEPPSQEASDNRDKESKTPRMVHFVTLNNLKPNTDYYYQIKNDSQAYPSKALKFKTASVQEKPEGDLTFSFSKPLKGTILNTNLNPVDESLVFLEIPGAQELAAFSSTAGNFVLPLGTVLNKELDKAFTIASGSKAQLKILKGSLKSEVKIMISEETVNLPPITIGSNLDLENFKPQPLNIISLNQTQGSDFNSDGTVNSLDLAMLKEAAQLPGANNTQTQSKFDINSDGIIDQADVDLFSKRLLSN